MKKLLLFCLFFCILPGSVFKSGAKHLFGGDLQYTNISGNTYKVSLTLYGDCSAPADVFGQLSSATPEITVYKNGSLFSSGFALSLKGGSGAEVSPVCPSEINNTACHSTGSLPGVKQFIYEGNITLDGPSTNWQFFFFGKLGGGYQAGRSLSITNIQPNSQMQLSATLDNSSGPNSSPAYSTIPTPFYCINVLQQYNQGASDPENDSLSFNLVTAMDASGSSSVPVMYNYPFTAAFPLSTTAGGFSFNSLNGQMTFTPDAIQDALIVNRVYEYRSGHLVGTSEREMAFIVRDNCNGIPPTAVVTSITGASLSGANVINICRGEPSVHFTIGINNPDGDSTLLTYGGMPSGAVFTISNNNTASPSADFSWATGSLAAGNYTFYINLKNKHCPIYNTSTIAYTIRVVNYPTISTTVLSQTNCIHKAAVEFNLAYGFLPRKVTITQGGVVIKTLIDSTGNDSSGVIIDSLEGGNYIAMVSSDSMCSSSVSFIVADSGSFKLDSVNYSLCLGDPTTPVDITPVAIGATITWYNMAGTVLSTPPIINTSTTANYSWYFIERFKTCSSGPVNVNAAVHSLPIGSIIDIPQTVCYGDKIYLKAEGGVNNTWMPTDLVKTDTGGPFIEILAPVTMHVKITDEFNCSDTQNVTYANVQQCCNFNYPNAFTPNDDGRNDGYKVVTYGNMLHYNLTIFNRWGQPLYQTSDPKKEWDGTWHGIPCDAGTYFYYLEAQCLTGPKEFHKGDIILIR